MYGRVLFMEKKTVSIRGIKIGAGKCLVCVPVTAANRKELEEALNRLAAAPDTSWDMAEWRADYYEGIRDPEQMKDALKMLRSALGEKPFLFTYRTKNEGGQGEMTGSGYRHLLLAAAASALVDLVDVELFTAGSNAQVLVGELHLLGTAVIGSSHDFTRTPSQKEMLSRLLCMQELGMDITKLAVMPEDRSDVVRLLDIAAQMEDQYGDRPCVTMAMGPLGVLSRVSASLTGNAISFGTIGAQSAPGQLPADRLCQVLEWLEPVPKR